MNLSLFVLPVLFLPISLSRWLFDIIFRYKTSPFGAGLFFHPILVYTCINTKLQKTNKQTKIQETTKIKMPSFYGRLIISSCKAASCPWENQHMLSCSCCLSSPVIDRRNIPIMCRVSIWQRGRKRSWISGQQLDDDKHRLRYKDGAYISQLNDLIVCKRCVSQCVYSVRLLLFTFENR
jgi:hypothetical protein